MPREGPNEKESWKACCLKMHGIRSPGNRGEPDDEEVKPNRRRNAMKYRQRGMIGKAQGKALCSGKPLQGRIWSWPGNG